MSEFVLNCQGLGRDYGKFSALANVDLNLKAGTVVAMLGPNGAGKTTLLNMLTGKLEPTRGSAEILGCPVRDIPTRQPGIISYMGDDTEPPAWSTARQLIAMRNQLGNFDAKLADEILAYKQLDLKKPFGNFSKGQKKWILAALILAGKSQVIIMDEPAEGLDPLSRIRLYEYLRRQVSDNNSLAIIATHIINDIETIADEVVMIDHGRLIVHEDTETMRDQVREVFVPEGSDMPGFITAAKKLNTKTIPGGTLYWIRQTDDNIVLPPNITIRPISLTDFYVALVGEPADSNQQIANSKI